MLSDFPTKHASNSLVTFVPLKRFVILLLSKLPNDIRRLGRSQTKAAIDMITTSIPPA